MNISLFKRSWIRYYKRGFGTGLFIMSFILVVDQFLDKPLFFSKITNLYIFLFIVSTIFFASGFPAAGDIPASSFSGQLVGCIVMFLVGFVPGYGLSFIMKMMDWLRVPDHVQEAGIDSAELGLRAHT